MRKQERKQAARRKSEQKRHSDRRGQLKNRSHPYVQGILTGFRSDDLELADLKSESGDVIDFVLSRVATMGCPEAKYAGPTSPGSYKDFARFLPASDADSLADELRWSAAILERQSGLIENFLIRAASFESSLIAGDIASARGEYDTLIQECGHSIWSIEAGIFLAECEAGLSANRQFATFVSDNTDDVYADLIAKFASNRAERNLSVRAYRQSVQTLVLNDTPFDRWTHTSRAYFLFHADFYSLKDYTKNQLAGILNLESTFSLIDRYTSFVRILLLLACTSGLPALSDLPASTLRRLAFAIGDSRLYALRHLTDPATPHADNPVRTLYLDAEDAYVTGDFEAVINLSSNAIARYPAAFEFYELNAKASVHLGSPPTVECHPNSLQQRVLLAVHSVIRRDAGAADSLHALEKIAYSLCFSRFGDQLFSFVIECAPRGVQWKSQLGRALTGVGLSPTAATLLPRLEDRIAFLSAMSKDREDRTTQTLMTSILLSEDTPTPESLPTNIPRTERLLRLAAEAERDGDRCHAVELYDAALKNGSNAQVYFTEAISGLVRCLLSLGHLERAASTVVDSYLNNVGMSTLFPIDRLIDLYEHSADRDRNVTLSWPVLYHFFYKLRELPRNDKRLFRLQDGFLASQGVDRPSQLEHSGAIYPAKALIYYLRHVCVPEILDSSISYDSSQDLDNERLAICQYLARLDPGDPADEQEIERLKQTSAIRAALQTVDHTKVYVDIPGIKRSFDSTFEEAFARYRLYRGLEARFRQSCVEIGDATIGKKTKSKTSIVYVDESLRLFNLLFREVLARYISSNEYGLDSYLSIRIRHGILAGQLRGSFESRQLVTTKSGNADVYSENTYWKSQLGAMSPAEWSAIDRRLAQFSRTVDQWIDKIKNEWIQVRSEAKPSGLFNFDYSDFEVGALYSRFAAMETLAEFTDATFAELNARAERVLSSVRSRLDGEFRTTMLEALDTLERDVGALHPPVRNTMFPTAVNQCSTDIQRDIDTVVTWFRSLADAQGIDVPLSYIAQASLEYLKKGVAAGAIDTAVDIKCDSICPGSAFTHLFDVVHILLANALAHSKEIPPRLLIQVDSVGERCKLSVRNRLGPDVDVRTLRENAKVFAQRANRTNPAGLVRLEGGSGFYKIGRLLQVNLRFLSPEVEINVVSDDDINEFHVSVTMNAKGIAR